MKLCLFALLLSVMLFSGCASNSVAPGDDLPVPEPKMSPEKEKAKFTADTYIDSLESAPGFGGENFRLFSIVDGHCPDCWDFMYEFDVPAENKVDMKAGMINISVEGVKITSVMMR